MNRQSDHQASVATLAGWPPQGATPYRAEHIALFIHSLAGGGAQRRAVSLANGFAERGRAVDLVAVSSKGALRDQIAPAVRLVGLDGGDWDRTYVRMHPWLPSLTAQVLLSARALGRYLAQVRPDVFLSAASYVNLVAVAAWHGAGRPMPLVLRASNHPAGNLPSRIWFRRLIRAGVRRLVARLYPQASAVIAVSQGVADEVVRVTGIPRERVQAIYNPVVTPELLQRASIPVQHPWLGDQAVPLILGVGRLNMQKDFPTLLRAFAAVHRQRPARLLILGEGPHRRQLLGLAKSLGLQKEVELPGFVENAPAWMARASLLVLSSLWEGLPGVLIEALAMGCPVVSTDCPSGPREILEGGRYGLLVPCQDPEALAKAMLRTLREPPDRDFLRARAAAFTGSDVPDRYLQVLDACLRDSPLASRPVVSEARTGP
jgi:glycosyltransferase involved in cell wall biosynthesis